MQNVASRTGLEPDVEIEVEVRINRGVHEKSSSERQENQKVYIVEEGTKC